MFSLEMLRAVSRSPAHWATRPSIRTMRYATEARRVRMRTLMRTLRFPVAI